MDTSCDAGSTAAKTARLDTLPARGSRPPAGRLELLVLADDALSRRVAPVRVALVRRPPPRPPFATAPSLLRGPRGRRRAATAAAAAPPPARRVAPLGQVGGRQPARRLAHLLALAAHAPSQSRHRASARRSAALQQRSVVCQWSKCSASASSSAARPKSERSMALLLALRRRLRFAWRAQKPKMCCQLAVCAYASPYRARRYVAWQLALTDAMMYTYPLFFGRPPVLLSHLQ